MSQQPPSALHERTETQAKPPGVQRPRSSSRAWLWILILALIAGAAWYFYPRQKTQAPADAKGKGPGGRGAPPAQVVAVKSYKGDIGVYVTALGTVTPVYTVTVKSRVDGQLLKVHYTEGQLVKEGDPLVDIDPRPFQAQLEQYQGQLARDQATLENARVDLARYEQLILRKAVAEQTLTTQKATIAQGEGNVKTDQGLIESAKLNIAYSHITAPITGRVGLRLVDPGNYIQAGSSTPLAVITQVQPISVIFTVSEDQLPAVLQKTHSGKRLQVEAYDRSMTTRLATGYLTTLDNQIDQTTGTLKLRAILDNRNSMLVANQFVNARLLIEQKHNVTLVGNAAIQRNAKSTYVYVVKPDSTVTIRDVKLGTTEGDVTEVTSGIEPGEVLVMTGVDRLQEGSKVNAHLNDAPARAIHSGARNNPGGTRSAAQ
jgi:multidrug efflux system membrane fusion protein